jgi:probable F420-dependent oxidoreductase
VPGADDPVGSAVASPAVQLDGPLITDDLAEVPTLAADLEAAGFDGAWTVEGRHDPFVTLTLAAAGSTRLTLSSAIAVALARNPMSVAVLGNDLQLASRGRFRLGLGSQVRAHVERRFSMPWSPPAERMRELVAAVRAIWSAWATGERLAFEGELYRHTLMPPALVPGPNPWGPPPIWLAGVGPVMTALAGEVADGYWLHPFATERSVRELSLRALGSGLEAARRPRAAIEVGLPVIVATGDGDELDRAVQVVRAQVAFYASTPAYRPVLDVHGWGELQPELRSLTRSGDWAAMAAQIPDEVLHAVAVVAPPEHVGPEVKRRYGGLVDRIALDIVEPLPPELAGRLVAGFRA